MKIGIIGGGQLGMMMGEAAKKIGHSIISLDPNPNCSITKFSDVHIAKPYDDKEALQFLYDTADVITYEFENVDLDVLNSYQDKLPQGTKALKISRNRLLEKEFATSLNILTPNYSKVIEYKDIFYPSILKTTTGGYDGKGQFRLLSDADLKDQNIILNQEMICEDLIDFDYEISVICTRARDGKTVAFPIPVNTHKNGILHTSIVDDLLPEKVIEQAIQTTEKIITHLEYVGTLAVEYFVKDNILIFNEFAPRPHNSGHYTIDGCNVSQFMNHILAITNEQLITPKLIKKTIMINVLGQTLHYYKNAKQLKHAFIHDYLKNSNQTNRKVGHITITYTTQEELNLIRSKFTEEPIT